MALPIVLVTLMALLLLWSTAYCRCRGAVAARCASVDRAVRVAAPALAAARALAYLESGALASGTASFQTTVPTNAGDRTCAITFQCTAVLGGGRSRWLITVVPAQGEAHAGLPVLP
jgi:hypothetical protein